MAIFNSYVCLPKGTNLKPQIHFLGVYVIPVYSIICMKKAIWAVLKTQHVIPLHWLVKSR